MTLLRPLFLIAVLTALIILAAPAGTRPAAAQPLDWGMLGCELVDGPGPDSLTLLVTVSLVESPDFGQFDAPIDILFNGLPWDQHTITAIPEFLLDCPQVAGCPPPTPPPCGRTTYGFKGVVWQDDWKCLRNFNTNHCDCVKPGDPVPHEKRIRKPPPNPPPPIPSFFDVFVDLPGLIPETNENNNRCVVPYSPTTATEPRSWGTVKALYR
jgi:hypothetical protein